MKTRTILYSFVWAAGQHESIRLEFDAATLVLVNRPVAPFPEWTQLSCHQCPHCPIKADDQFHCPLAISIAGVVERFRDIFSHDEIFLQVENDERTVSQKTTAQRAVSSFMGVVMATSGCPHTAFFKPMARFHLPLASEEETIYRSASMYLLAQFFLAREGGEADFSLVGLDRIYRNIQIVNSSLVDRLRQASKADSSANAIILLDMFARIMPLVIEDKLEDIRYLFEPYFQRLSIS